MALKFAGTRRELLVSLLGLSAAGGACRKPPAEPRWEGELVPTAMGEAHRHFQFGTLHSAGAPEEPEREIRILILGSGVAGLSAGWELMRRGVRDFSILEMEDAAGGTSRSGRSAVCEYPWAAHYLPAPPARNADLVELLREAGSVAGVNEQGEVSYREDHLTAAPKERVFFRGSWQEGLFPRAGAGSADLEQLARFEREVSALAEGGAFAIPVAHSADRPELRALDQLTMHEWLTRRGFDSPLLRWWVEYAARDDFGTELSQLSAWYGLHYFASRGEGSSEFLTWPAGNGHLVHHLAERVGRERILPGHMATRLELTADTRRARVTVWDRARSRTRRYLAEHVICALPSFLRERLLPEGAPRYRPEYVPWMVANLHLSDRPGYHGFPTAWDNVVYNSRSLGYVVATHQLHRDRGPTVWTYYLPFSSADVKRERNSLLSLSWREACDAITRELAGCHLGFVERVQRIDVMKWGHAMVRPAPGMAFSSERARAASPFGPIHFAHTDLSGVALFEEAFFHGVRAAREVAGPST